MVEELIRYGYLVLFVGTIVEGDVTLATAGFLAHQGYFSLLPVMLVATVATTAVNEFYYQVAFRRGEGFFRRKAGEDPRYARVRDWVRRRGVLLLFFSRFLFGFRVAIPVACGAVGMTRKAFSTANLLGAVVWSLVMSLAGYFLGSGLSLVWADLKHHEGMIVAMLLLLAFAGLVLWHRRDFREEVTAVRHPAELTAESADAMVRLEGRAHQGRGR